MADQPTLTQQDIRYESDERPPFALTIGLGFQYAALVVAGIVLTPVMMIKIASGSEAYLSWAVFAALVISGITSVVQAVRIGHVGAGYFLLMGSSGAFIAADEINIEDRMALLSERAAGPSVERELSLRLLQHYASSVRHQQYYDTDVVTVRVDSVAS